MSPKQPCTRHNDSHHGTSLFLGQVTGYRLTAPSRASACGGQMVRIYPLKWLWEMETVEWPEWIDDSAQPPPVAYVKENKLRITYINHATVLIQMDGINILTDPIWSERASYVSWAGPKRIRAPGVRMRDLPNIDIILISHDHFDHLDIPAVKQLVKDHEPVVLVGLGVKKRLAALKSIIELDWWQEYFYSSGMKITFVPSRHSR